MLLFFVRHGHPIYKPDRLTAPGRAQARAIGERMAAIAPDHVCVSSANRAIETALPTCERLGLTPEVLDWCNEKYAFQGMHVLRADGKPVWCFTDEPTIRRFNEQDVVKAGQDWIEMPEFKENGLADGFIRIRDEANALLASLGFSHEGAFYRMTEKPKYDRVALFAHEGFGRAFLSSILDIPYPLFSTHFFITYTSLTVIEFEDTDQPAPPHLMTFANDAHLYKNNTFPSHFLRLNF